MTRIAVVTGANRGLGLETCRQLAQQGYQVILTSRDAVKGEAAAASLQQQGLTVTFHPLEVTDPDSVAALANFLQQQFHRLDVLVNNAGILPDPMNHSSVFEANIDTVRQAMETNVYGALRLCQALVPLMKANGYGRIVNVSSGMGQLSEMNGGYPAYRFSKTALNALTRILADELQGTNILVNSVCPGWVRTDMGGPSAPRLVEQGADTIVWLATLPDGSASGGFYRDRQPIPW
jgi:NAD(P)-dependent dehydrogenase (short-subunit alcohol dehydrogenase family)